MTWIQLWETFWETYLFWLELPICPGFQRDDLHLGKKKKKKTHWKSNRSTEKLLLFVCLSMANIPILSRTWRPKGAGKCQLSHSWAWSSGFTGFQSPDRQTTPELGRERKLCFRGNLSNKKTTYSSKMELNQIWKTSYILPSKVTVLGITSSYDCRVYFWISCSWT